MQKLPKMVYLLQNVSFGCNQTEAFKSHPETSEALIIKWTTSGEPPVGLRNHTPGIYICNLFECGDKTLLVACGVIVILVSAHVLTCSVLLLITRKGWCPRTGGGKRLMIRIAVND